jgi:hypothetical protein
LHEEGPREHAAVIIAPKKGARCHDEGDHGGIVQAYGQGAQYFNPAVAVDGEGTRHVEQHGDEDGGKRLAAKLEALVAQVTRLPEYAPYGYGQDRQESRVAGVEQCLHQLGPLVITHFFHDKSTKLFLALKNYFSRQCLAVQVACNYAIASLQRWYCIALATLKCRGNVLQMAVKQLQICEGRTSSTATVGGYIWSSEVYLDFLAKNGFCQRK